MSKHAYLIMAHNELNLLRRLIMLLDDPRNDIYIHVDQKAKDFKPESFSNLANAACLHFIERQNLSWGAFSLVRCELALLKEAVKTHHDYYHLLSGVDLPLKSQDEIHEFFFRNSGREFLLFHNEILTHKSFYARIQYYHFLQEQIGHKRESNLPILINRVLLRMQQAIGVDRIRKTRNSIRKGEQWFSITHDFASFVLSCEKEINRTYRNTFCPDEVFLHTLAWNSKFKEKICDSSMRCIDWKRGRPYTYKSDDFEMLMRSEALWARKFSESVEPVIVQRIFNRLKNHD